MAWTADSLTPDGILSPEGPFHGILSPERPFPGLRPFEYSDHEFFFGREEQSYSLYTLLELSQFVAVVGSSGSGKSSLVRAGLLPLLARESEEVLARSSEQPGGRAWRSIELRPGNVPLSRLAGRLSDLSAAEDEDALARAARRERIDYALRRSSFGLCEALAGIDAVIGRSLLIVVDQFEELFRYGGSGVARQHLQEEGAQFVQLLLEATSGRSRDVHVLITMRSDFIGDCARFYGLPEAVSSCQFLVPSLTRDQREEVIRRPLEEVEAAIEPALVERLLNDVGNELDQLPVLQHCLLRLWEVAGPSGGAPPRRRLRLEHYAAVGGIAGALSQHADTILTSLPGHDLAVEQVFRALSEVDKEGRATRRALSYAQLQAETGIGLEELRLVLDRFRADDCSFLLPSISVELELRPDTRIDVGHEALLRRWERISGDNRPEVGDEGQRRGWLWAEEEEGRVYRAWLTLGPGATLPEVERRWAAWLSRPRTAAWAERYGGHLPQIEQLFKDNLTALEAERRKRDDDEAAERARLARERQQLEHEARLQASIAKRTRLVAMLSFGFAVVVLALGLWAWKSKTDAEMQKGIAQYQSVVASKEKENAEVQARDADKQRAIALAATKKAQSQLGKLFLERGREALLDGANDDAGIFLAAAYGYDPENRFLQLLLREARDKLSIRGDSVHAHDGLVSVLEFSPDGKWLATAGADGSIKIWDASSRLIHIFDDQNDLITALRFDATGRYLVTGSRDGSARVRTLDGVTLASAPAALDLKGHDDRINSAEFNRDGSRVLTASNDATIKVWNTSTGQLLLDVKGREAGATGAVFAGDSDRWIVSGAIDGSVRVWDAASGKSLKTLRDKGMPIVRITVDAAGRYVAAAGNDGFILIYDLATDSLVTAGTEHHGSINALAFDGPGRRLVSASDDGMALVWDVRTGNRNPVAILSAAHDSRQTGSGGALRVQGPAVLAAAFSTLGDVIATTYRDGSVSLWNPDGTTIAGLRAHRGEVRALAFAPGGELFATGGADGDVYFWHPRGSMVPASGAHAGAIESIAFDRDGRRVVTASRDGTAAVWQLDEGLKKIATLRHAQGGAWVTSASFDPTGERVVTSGGNDKVLIWSMAGASASTPIVATVPQATIAANSAGKRLVQAMFLPVGNQVVAGQRAAVPPGDVNTNKWIVWRDDGSDVIETEPVPQSSIRTLQPSRNGHFLLARSDNGVATFSWVEGNRVYSTWYSVSQTALSKAHFFYAIGRVDGAIDIKSQLGEQVRQLGAHRGRVTALAFSNDDRFLGSAGGEDLFTKIWEVDSGDLCATLVGHKGIIESIEFSPDAAFVLTTSQDGTAKLWDRQTGLLVVPISAGSTPVRRAVFTPDGSAIVIGAEDGGLYLLDLRNQEADPPTTARNLLRVVNYAYSERRASDPLLVEAKEALERMGYGLDAMTQRAREQRVEVGLAAAATNQPTRAADNLLPMAIGGSEDASVRLAAAALGARFSAMRRTLRTGSERIERVAFAEAGRKLVTGSFDMTAKVWDVETGQLLHTLAGFDAPVTTLWTQRKGNLAVVAGLGDREARVWDLDTGQERYRLDLGGALVKIAYFSDDGSRIVTRNDTTVRVWDSADGKKQFDFRQEEPIVSSAISRDGTLLALATKTAVRLITIGADQPPVAIDARAGDGAPISRVLIDPVHPRVFTLQSKSVRLWDARYGRLIQEFASPVPLYDVELAHSGDLILAAAEGSGLLWRVGENEPKRLSGPVSSSFNLFSDDDHRLFTGAIRREAAVWDVATGRLLGEFAGSDTEWVAIDITPDGGLLATATDDGVVHLWDAAEARPLETRFNHGGDIADLQIDIGGTRLLTRGSDGSLSVWDATRDQTLWRREAEAENELVDARLSVDGTTVVEVLRQRDTGTAMRKLGEDQPPSLRHEGADVDTHHTGDVGPESRKFAVLLLASENGQVKKRYETVTMPSVSRSGQYLVLWEKDGRIQRIGVNDGTKVEWSADAKPLLSVRFAKSDELVIAEADDRTVTIWGRERGPLLMMKVPYVVDVNAAASFDSKWLLTLVPGTNPTLWNLATVKPVAILNGHRGDVTDGEFSPDGSEILTVGDDGTSKRWSVKDGRLLQTLGSSATERLVAGRFSPDGQSIVSASETGAIKVWNRSGIGFLGLPTASRFRVRPEVFGNLNIFAADGGQVVLYRVGDAPSREELWRLADRLGADASALQPPPSETVK